MSASSPPALNVLPEHSASTTTRSSPLECEIFISYRHEPDENLATALQKQLENSLHPAPRVFVSGSGGLQPSSVPWGMQLQRAAQSAKAIIGIITQASKQREWISFGNRSPTQAVRAS